MPEFISKLQYKTYEKGEFSDERPSGLEETIKLIKDFPWDKQRGADVQLTSPSVTIQDEYLNYLKVAVYFNGKFCLYYLDRDNHLYECSVKDLTDACVIVNDFFTGQLDLQKFDKHIFNIGNQPHFITAYFEYRLKLRRVFNVTGFMLFYALFFVAADYGILSKGGLALLPLVLVAFSLLYFYIMARIYYTVYINRHNYIQISKGNDVFSFGYDEDSIKVYHKAEVVEIIHYANQGGGRNPNFIEVFELTFTNGDQIKLSNMLISGSNFLLKFSDSMDNLQVPVTMGKRSSIKEFWGTWPGSN